MSLAATRTAGAEFAELICDDPEWLRAEFDALISASFSEPPTAPPAAPPRLPPDRGSGYPVRGPRTDQLATAVPWWLVVTGRARQRAPPP